MPAFYLLSSEHGIYSTFAPHLNKCILIGTREVPSIYKLRRILYDQKNNMNLFANLRIVNNKHKLSIATNRDSNISHHDAYGITNWNFEADHHHDIFNHCNLFLFEDIQHIDCHLLTLNGAYIDMESIISNDMNYNEIIENLNKQID